MPCFGVQPDSQVLDADVVQIFGNGRDSFSIPSHRVHAAGNQQHRQILRQSLVPQLGVGVVLQGNQVQICCRCKRKTAQWVLDVGIYLLLVAAEPVKVGALVGKTLVEGAKQQVVQFLGMIHLPFGGDDLAADCHSGAGRRVWSGCAA